jgi:hypothetical protein
MSDYFLRYKKRRMTKMKTRGTNEVGTLLLFLPLPPYGGGLKVSRVNPLLSLSLQDSIQ